jgi:hypothetical protein
MERYMASYGGAHSIFLVLTSRQVRFQRFQQIDHGAFHDVEQQLFLAGKVVIDTRFLNAAPFGNVADACGEIPLFEKQIDGNGLDRFFHFGHRGSLFLGPASERRVSQHDRETEFQHNLPTGR